MKTCAQISRWVQVNFWNLGSKTVLNFILKTISINIPEQASNKTKVFLIDEQVAVSHSILKTMLKIKIHCSKFLKYFCTNLNNQHNNVVKYFKHTKPENYEKH